MVDQHDARDQQQNPALEALAVTSRTYAVIERVQCKSFISRLGHYAIQQPAFAFTWAEVSKPC